jgi:putative membrane protein
MITTENGEYEEGQGSLVHLKYKFYALVLFFISGFLGIFAFDNTVLMQPLIKFGEPSILLPLLSGLFGASMLVISLMTKSWGQLIMNRFVHRYCMKKFIFSYEGVSASLRL